MPQVTIPHPDTDDKAKTFSSTAIAIGATSVQVQSTGGFNQNDYVVIGLIDNDEKAEIEIVSSVIGAENLIIGTALHAHPTGVLINKIKYNQGRVYSSTSQNGSYSLLTTMDLQPGYPGGTRYDDLVGNTSTWYQVSWYNSNLGMESTLSEPFQVLEGPDGYVDNSLIEMIKDVAALTNDTGFNYTSYDLIKRKINLRQQMWWLSPYTKRALKKTRIYTTTQNQNYITMDAEFDKFEGDYAVRYHHVIPQNTGPVTTLLTTPGNLSSGSYYYVVSFVISTGETPPGTPSLVLVVDNPAVAGQISLTNIPVDPTGQATSRKIYRTQANGSSYTLVTIFNDNTTTTYTDDASDTSIVNNAVPVLSNPGINQVDEYYDLIIDSLAQFYENYGNNLNIVPTEDLAEVAYFESGTTKQLLIGPTPSTNGRQIIVTEFIKPTNMVNPTDVTICPIPRLLTLPVAIEILNTRGDLEKIEQLEKDFSELIPGEIEHGREKSGNVAMRFRKDYGHFRYVKGNNKTNT